jgi:hypothetical protein
MLPNVPDIRQHFEPFSVGFARWDADAKNIESDSGK